MATIGPIVRMTLQLRPKVDVLVWHNGLNVPIWGVPKIIRSDAAVCYAKGTP
jgi:hypothetical protein